MATYSTKQQQAVLRCIETHAKQCVSAAELSELLREQGSPIGVATVYRQLEKLEKQGRLHKVVTEEGACYHLCTQETPHDCFLLKCEKCGRIEHVDCEKLAPLYRHLEQEHHFAINPCRTMFYGVCEQCREAEA